MESSSSTIILAILTLLLSQTHLSEPFRPTIINPITTDRPIDSMAEVHDILTHYGLPKGLLPNNVKSYSLADDGSFEIELSSDCYVHFSDLVYYDNKIKGKLGYGTVSDVSGIQAKKLFVWVSVTGIVAHPEDGTVEFDVGFLSEELPASQFEEIPVCKSKLTQSI